MMTPLGVRRLKGFRMSNRGVVHRAAKPIASAVPVKALGVALTGLCPVDGSDNAERAARWIGRAAPRFGDVTVELLSVQPPFALAEGKLDALPQRFDRRSRRIGAAAIDAARAAPPVTGLRLRQFVRIGDVIAEMRRPAEGIDADVIVPCARTRSGARSRWTTRGRSAKRQWRFCGSRLPRALAHNMLPEETIQWSR